MLLLTLILNFQTSSYRSFNSTAEKQKAIDKICYDIQRLTSEKQSKYINRERKMSELNQKTSKIRETDSKINIETTKCGTKYTNASNCEKEIVKLKAIKQNLLSDEWVARKEYEKAINEFENATRELRELERTRDNFKSMPIRESKIF